MNFQNFRKEMFELGCFTSTQAYAMDTEFDKNSLGRWVKKGLLVKLRNGHYTFSEYIGESGFALYIANRIYRPSYISLQTALSFYGLIPESVVQMTSVTTLKTASFRNRFGTYSYKTIRPNLMFGYDVRPLSGNRSLFLAKPEKALLDILYLYPFYNTKEELEALRLDPYFMQDNINVPVLKMYASGFHNTQLENRTELLLNTYGL